MPISRLADALDRRTLLLGMATLSLGISGGARAQIPQERVTLGKDGKAVVKGRLKGKAEETKDFVVTMSTGDTLVVTLKSGKSTYFNVVAKDSAEAVYRGELDGKNAWRGFIPEGGEYTIRVFLSRAAARRGASSSYTLTIATL